MLSNFKDVISRLEKQKAAIDRALTALREFDEGDVPSPAASKKAVKKAAKKRVLSEEGRQRIAEAARRRWAAKKKGSKKLASAA